MAAGGVLEEVIDALLFHQAAGKRKIGLVILDAVLTLLEGPLDFIIDIEALKHSFEDLGNGLLLKGAAVLFTIEEPAHGYDFERVVDEFLVFHALRDTADHAVD